jgi:hypothetical protein
MEPDDLAYKKSVRNMSLVLAAIVITIFAAIFVSPYAFPPSDTFQTSATLDSAFGFTLHIQINSTAPASGAALQISGWLNSSSASIDNVTAADSWGSGPGGLWTHACTDGWPIGVGIMQGHYTQDNYTMGTLVQIPMPATYCPVTPSPTYFLLDPHSSTALVDLNGVPQYWVLQSSYSFPTGGHPSGVYTAVLADEWGDVVTTNFRVS